MIKNLQRPVCHLPGNAVSDKLAPERNLVLGWNIAKLRKGKQQQYL